MTPDARILRSLLEQHGWRPGTSLENHVAWRLHRYGIRATDCAQQYRVGVYRLDFAFVDVLVALEADGWHHQRPDMAARDANRDRELRRRGWLVLRVNDEQDEQIFQEQLVRVVVIVRALSQMYGKRGAA